MGFLFVVWRGFAFERPTKRLLGRFFTVSDDFTGPQRLHI